MKRSIGEYVLALGLIIFATLVWFVVIHFVVKYW